MLVAASVHADPLALTDTQMDAVTAGALVTIAPPGTDPIEIAETVRGTTTVLAGGSDADLPTDAIMNTGEGDPLGSSGLGQWSADNANSDVVGH